MSDSTYPIPAMDHQDKPLRRLAGEVKTPPFSQQARLEAGFYLRKLQQGEMLPMPISRTMKAIGKHCHELRIVDENKTWRINYRIDDDAILILEVFHKTSRATPKHVIQPCQKRLRDYDSI